MKEKINNIDIINRPIVLVAFGLFFSSLGYGLWDFNKELAILINILYIGFVIIIERRLLFIFIILIQLIMLGTAYNYYERVGEIKEIRVVEIKGRNIVGESNGRSFILSGNIEGLKNGDKIDVKGEFEEWAQKDRGIVGKINISSYKLLKKDFKGGLIEKREEVISKLRENIGDRKSGLVASISYGDKSFLDSEDNKDMNRMGIIHAISVSGMHIFLIYSLFTFLIGKKFSLVVTIFYVIFTGGAISSVRALLMIILSVFSISARRNYDGIGAICFSGIIIMLWKPYCVFNIGFLLSYSATFGIILFREGISSRLYKLPKFLRDGISISLSAQILSLPIILFFFKSMSINFLIGNIILIPLVNIILILGNLLPLLISFDRIFDFISYSLIKVINLLDYLLEFLYTFSYDAFMANSSVIKLMVACLIFAYFYFKCRRFLVSVPLAFLMVFVIEMYSPFMTIEYYKNGALAVRYRGESAIISSKRNINIKSLKGTSKIDRVYLEEESVDFNRYSFKKDDKNYILKSGDGEVLLNLGGKEVQGKSTYDIIDFDKDKINKIMIVDNRVFKVY